MSSLQLAFFTGLFGSIHCIGMCGPLAFAIPFTGRQKWLLVWDKLIYQFGRILAYSSLGMLTGLIGRQLWLFDMQQGVSVISGSLILLAAGSRLFKHSFTRHSYFNILPGLVNKLIVYAVKQRAGHFFIGILNGFLPCGFVYLALAGAVNMQSVQASVQYMFWFGLGTLPLMLAATLSAGMLSVNLRNRLNKIVPYFMICLGVWFVMRGLALNIPYVSPAKISSPAVCR